MLGFAYYATKVSMCVSIRPMGNRVFVLQTGLSQAVRKFNSLNLWLSTLSSDLTKTFWIPKQISQTVQKIWNIFSQARPHSQFLHSCIWERFIYSQDLYLESLFSCIARENSQLNRRAKRRAKNCRQAVVGGSSLPSPPLLWLTQEFT